jgi:hypothetical protein
MGDTGIEPVTPTERAAPAKAVAHYSSYYFYLALRRVAFNHPHRFTRCNIGRRVKVTTITDQWVGDTGFDRDSYRTPT